MIVVLLSTHYKPSRTTSASAILVAACRNRSIAFDGWVELLNQKTEEIEQMMNEKKALVADVLQIARHDYDTVSEVWQHVADIV